MILSNINIGSGPDVGDGEPIRSAFNTVNNNFANILLEINGLSGGGVTTVAGRTGNVRLTANDIYGLSNFIDAEITSIVGSSNVSVLMAEIDALNQELNDFEISTASNLAAVTANITLNTQNIEYLTTNVTINSQNISNLQSIIANISGNVSSLVNGNYSVSLGNDGALSLSSSNTILGNSNVAIQTVDNGITNTWLFGGDGTLLLPLMLNSASLIQSPGTLLLNAINSEYVFGWDSTFAMPTNGRITFGGPSLRPPSEVSRNELITLYDFGAEQVNYGIGIEDHYIWTAVDSSSAGFKWYAGTSTILTVDGIGNVTLTGGLTFPDNTTQITAFSNTAISTYLSSASSQSFGNDVTVIGNLIVQGNIFSNGNVTLLNTNNLIINDNIIYLANTNPSNSLDIGIAGHFTVDGVYQHTGFIRQASTNTWKLFSNVSTEPSGTVDFTNAMYDDIQVGNIISPSITSLQANSVAQQTSIYNLQANTIAQEIEIQSITSNIITIQDDIGNLYSNSISQQTLISTLQANTYSNIQVEAYLSGTTYTSYSNINVAAYISTNLSPSLYSNVNVAAYLAGNVIVGNISATYFTGNGAFLTGLPAGYSNVQVATYLPTYYGNIGVANVNLAPSSSIWLNSSASYLRQTGSGASISLSGSITLAPDIAANPLNGVIIGGNGYLLSPNGSRNAVLNYNSVSGQMGIYQITVYGNQTSSIINGGTSGVGNIGSPTGRFNTVYAASIDASNLIITSNLVSSGNVTSTYFIGNGSQLTGLPSSYSNIQVAAYLATYTGNIGNITLSTGGIITFPDGSVQTTAASGGSSNYSNINVAAYLTSQNITSYSNVNVKTYLSVFDGNIVPSANITYNLGSSSNLWNTVYSTNLLLTGNTQGYNELTVGTSNSITYPYQVALFTSSGNGYSQINTQNLSSQSQASTDYVATANNGNDSTYFIDMGITGSGYVNTNPTNAVQIGNVIYPNDGYLFTQGNTATTTGGNLVIGTGTPRKFVKIFGGPGNLIAQFDTANGLALNTISSFPGTNGNITVNPDGYGLFVVTSITPAWFGNTLTVVGNITGNTNGYAIGYRDIPQVLFSSNTTITTSDAGKHYYSTSSGTLGLTVANNAVASFNIGATINIINQGSGNIVIIPGSGVTMYLAGNGSSSSRTLSSYGMATITKVGTDTWFTVGVGLT